MRSIVVPTKNVTRLLDASEMLSARTPGLPGIGVVDGETGYGKSFTLMWLMNQINAIFVRAEALMAPSDLLRTILHELDVHPRGSNSQMLKSVVLAMRNARRPLIIDEVDYLIGSTRLIEAIRDIHDLSNQPVIVVGYTGLESRLAHLRQFTRRILSSVRFQPADLDDALMIAQQLCDVEVRADLVSHALDRAMGSTGELVTALARIEHHAKTRGLASIGLEEWGERELFSGSATREAATPTPPRRLKAVR